MKILRIAIIAALLLLAGFFYFTRTASAPKEVHYHAGFLVYIDGKREDFSKAQYMHIEPCTVPGVEHEEDDQIEKAHLHDNVGDAVHVHRENAFWKDLFTNIKYEIPKGKPVVGYRDGKEVKNILEESITQNDSIIIAIGNKKNVNLKKYVPQKHLKEIEAKRETCGS